MGGPGFYLALEEAELALLEGLPPVVRAAEVREGGKSASSPPPPLLLLVAVTLVLLPRRFPNVFRDDSIPNHEKEVKPVDVEG